ncbi:MAG: hypothetical protein CMH56_04325 [Myxococcales bacterium]|nr:hypothetical protein [Myxococcales bacterium]
MRAVKVALMVLEEPTPNMMATAPMVKPSKDKNMSAQKIRSGSLARIPTPMPHKTSPITKLLMTTSKTTVKNFPIMISNRLMGRDKSKWICLFSISAVRFTMATVAAMAAVTIDPKAMPKSTSMRAPSPEESRSRTNAAMTMKMLAAKRLM